MPMISHKYKIAYFPVPKVACTSLKHAIYALENGIEYAPSNHGGRKIQPNFPTQDFATVNLAALDGYWKIAVVRDPASRVISAYANKIEKWSNRLAKRKPDSTPQDGTPVGTPPTLIEFCTRLPHYRAQFGPIRHHTDSLATFLGPDLGFFDRVYRMEELDILCADITARTGQPFVLPHSNPSKPVDRTMNDEATAALLAYCAPDYQYLCNHYSAPAP